MVAVGDKARQQLQRVYANNIMLSVNDIGKKNITFIDASAITNDILSSGFEFDSGEVIYNRFKYALFTFGHKKEGYWFYFNN